MKHFNFLSTAKKLIVASAVLFGLSATAQTKTVYEIIADSPDHNTLEAAINAANLQGTLNTATATYTVFAPTDNAFAAFLNEVELTAEELLADEDLANILLYHVLGSSVQSGDLTNATFATTLEGDSAFVSLLTTGNFIDQAEITTADIAATNGIVHVINDVLLAQNSIVDVAVTNNFSILTQAVVTAELAPTLVDPLAGLTVFAPTDAAFQGLLSDLEITAEELLQREDLKDILLYHVVSGVIESGDLENGLYATTVQGDSSIISVIDGEGYVDQAMVTAFDVTADNGIVHVIDDVILPQNSLVDVAVSNGFSILTEAVVTAGLVPALVDPLSELTVFAPTDAAFVNLLEELELTAEELLASPDLANILLYHVLDAKVMATSVTNGLIATPLNEDNTLKFTIKGNGDVFVNQAEISGFDVEADNGVVHVLSAVVLANKTVVDVAIDNDFTTLVQAVVAAELVPALSNPFAKFTVFAPTNEAFADLGETLTELLEDPTGDLADILLYHVLGAEVASTDLTNGQIAETLLAGESITVDLTDGVKINTSTVALANVTSDNGIVHVIDKVLLPNSITSINDITLTLVELFPNPTTEYITVTTPESGLSFSITNEAGLNVMNGTLTNGKNTLPVNSLGEGVHFITLTTNEVSKTLKFVKK